MARHERPSDYLSRDVLQRLDFIDACQRRDLGAILAIAVKWGGTGFTVSHVARRCAMGITQVQAYIGRKRQPLSIDIFERTADGLHIPGTMLGISRRPWESEHGTQRSHGNSSEKPPDTAKSIIATRNNETQTVSDYESGEEADIILMLSEADRTDIGAGTLEGLSTIFDKLCRDYPSVPALELQQKLKRLYVRIARLRQGRMTFAQHRELIALSGWATALLACVDWDLNEREAAESASAATLRFAREIGHSELTAWSYELQAWFALTEGRYSDATDIAQAGRTIGGENSAIVQLSMQEARGWSRLGNRDAAESAIERGYDLLQRLPAISYPRHFVYDMTKFPFYTAACYQWLGDDAKAEELVNQVINECTASATTPRNPMRLADVQITLGLIQVHRGDVDGAVEAGHQALTYERRSGPSLLIRGSELGKAINERFPNTRQADDFSERLRMIYREFRFRPPSSDRVAANEAIRE